MNLVAWIIGGACLIFWVVFGVALWLHYRRQRGKPAPPPEVTIYEEPLVLPVNKPWSPTRGTYTFEVAELPEVYRDLPSLAGRDLTSQFGEDEQDARDQLTVRLMGELGRTTGRGTVELVTATPTAFKALTKRKGDRT